jgi:probable FeS assembly SUF system protein SufT
MTSELTLLADVTATEIPAGNQELMLAGTRLHVMQTLGGNVTVRTPRGLFRIAGADAAAIQGFDVSTLATTEATAGAAQAGGFSETLAWEALKTCFDPEIPVNIVDLGLVYDLAIETLPEGGRALELKMTLTAPGCGMGPVIAEDARKKLAALPGVATVKAHIVWEPQWTPQMISPEGRRILGLE